jgi:general secretion pathway protein H
VFEPDSYTVVQFDPQTMTWQSLEDAGQGGRAARFMSHQLPANIRLEVLNEAELPLSDSAEFAADRDNEDRLMPQFVSLSSGEVLPAELAVVLLEGDRVQREARMAYSSLYGLELDWSGGDD